MLSPAEEVKSRLDVAEVVGGYVRLAKSGANLKGLCPFHHEKTPSFYVSKERQIWHCFGCNLGGDIFSFVMRMEGVEFPDALRMLADRAGVEIRMEDPRVRSERARISEIVKSATAFYEETLAHDAQRDVREYLARRALTDATREAFHLGYAPSASWDALFRHLKFKQFRPEEIERSGLAVRGERGDYRDRFHNRIMFPLFDAQGNLVGFSGRVFESRHSAHATHTPAKYVNTPETLLYHKSSLLYGLHAAKSAIRERDCAVLVEGQFDLLLSHQAGVTNAVATSGTALTADHARTLRRYAANIATAFDSDTAGLAATRRSVMLLLANDLAVTIIRVTEGKDPADMVAQDPASWQKAVSSAEPVVEFFLARADVAASAPEEKRRIADDLLPLIRSFANPVLQGHYLSLLSASIGIDERFLHEAMRRLPQDASGEVARVPKSGDAAVSPRNRWTDIEEFLIAFLVKHRELGKVVLAHLSEELFAAEHTRTLFPFVYQWVAVECPGSTEQDVFPPEQRALLGELLLKAERYTESVDNLNPEKELHAFIHELAVRKLRERLRVLGTELKKANVDLRDAILGEFARVSAELQKREKQVTIHAVK